MKFYLIACGWFALSLANAVNGQQPTVDPDLSRTPVNRLGAHFDSRTESKQKGLKNFQNTVAASYGRPAQEPKKNPFDGLDPLIQKSIPKSTPAPPVQNSFEGQGLQAEDSTHDSQPAQQDSGDFGQESNTFGSPATSTQNPTNGAFGRTVASKATGDATYNISPCTVEFIDDIELPAKESGQIEELSVKEGDAVTAGNTIGQIDDELYLRMLEQAKLKLAIAKKKAEDSTSVMAAENEIQLASVDYKRAQSLASRGSMSASEREKAEFALKLAMLKKTAAQNEIDAAYGESKIEMARVREVEERIRRHSLATDFDGYVVEIFRHPLEWVDAGEKVMRIVRMDRLSVQGVLNTSQYNPHEVLNCPVTVTLKLARGETAEFQGKIVNVALERQGSDQILVNAEVDNRPIGGHWVLQPNCTVSMAIHLDGQP